MVSPFAPDRLAAIIMRISYPIHLTANDSRNQMVNAE